MESAILPSVFISGIAVHLPEKIETNQELDREFPDWNIRKVEAKTGIRERRIAAESETAADLAFRAARKLFASGVCNESEIDFVMFCTQTPDHLAPATACLLQSRLGLPTTCGAADINVGCSGFVYSLAFARGLICSGQSKNVLVLTGDTYSKIIRRDDRSNRALFGDAASATLVSSQSFPSSNFRFRIERSVLGTDGSGAPHLIVEKGGFRNPSLHGEMPALYMNGPEIFSFTLTTVPKVLNEFLEGAGLSIDDIDLIVPHQANAHMLHYLRERIGIAPEKFIIDLADCGNTVSSSIPLALARRLEISSGSPPRRMVFLGFGVGLSWGATLLTCEPADPALGSNP
jgi:3-oxoacyl-[acyl-carrier-protein] synthase-3